MTGLEAALINVLLNPDLVHAAMKRITDFFAAKMRHALECVGDLVDICYFADDLGGQQNLLMSRRAYRKVIQPYHAQLFCQVKEQAPQAAVMLHSDGAVFDILPDLIDAGLEVLEAVQTDTAGMDPARLKATYGENLSFHGGISVQALLPNEDVNTVYLECQRLVKVFGENGGYIAAPSHAIQVGTPTQNVLAMLRGVLGNEDYEAALMAARTDHKLETGS
jgi:uroporphyrinogen decarboxylase